MRYKNASHYFILCETHVGDKSILKLRLTFYQYYYLLNIYIYNNLLINNI